MIYILQMLDFGGLLLAVFFLVLAQQKNIDSNIKMKYNILC